MKKALTLALASLLCSVSCIEALAFEPETVETANEVTEQTVFQAALAEEDENTVDGYLKNDPAYGTLYYYNSFNDGVTIDGSKLTGQTYFDKKLAGEMLGSGFYINSSNYPLTLEAAEADSADKALKITASGALSFPRISINSQYYAKKLGIYTLVFDCKKTTGSVNLAASVSQYFDGNPNAYSVRSPLSAASDAWTKDLTYSVTVDGQTKDSGKNAIAYFSRFDLYDLRSSVAEGTTFSIDNVRLYYKPAVQVTYNYNLPVETATVYDLAKVNTVYDTTVTSALAEVGAAVPELYIPGYSFVGWKDAEGNPVEYYTAAASGLTLTAQWEAVKPGYNMLTGTTEKADFENGGRQYFYLGWVGANGARSVESFTLGDNTRRVLRVSGVATQYPTLVWPVKLESDRPYTFVWDSYADLAINSFNIWNLYPNSENKHFGFGVNTCAAANQNGEWYTNCGTTEIGCVGNKSNGAMVQLDFAYMSYASDSFNMYFDNLAVYPSYKITYILPDGSEVCDYVSYDKAAGFPETYTPKAALLGAKRYKLAADGESYSFDTPIPLANADITLYAVTDGYEVTAENVFSYRAPSEAVSAGIRFRANVSALVLADSDEFGFIVARTALLNGEELKFNADSAHTVYSADGKNFTGKTDGQVKYAGAVNHNKNGVNMIYDVDKDTNNTRFACMLVNLDKGYTSGGTTHENRYDVKFTVRPYVIIAGKTYYGDSTSKSYNDIAATNENA